MKKKIIIFTSSGGGGHISATKAIESYLSPEYEIQPVYIFTEVFKKIDPFSVVTLGALTGEKTYNYFLHRRWYSILNFIYLLGNWYFKLQSNAMKRMAKAYLKDQNADLIISVIPIINGVLLETAQSLQIPFLLIPTDLDATSFIRGINNPLYPKFQMVIAFDDPLIKATLAPANLAREKVTIAGLPLRKDFFEIKDKETIRKEHGVAPNKPVIVIMMGGQGNESIYYFALQLATLSIPAHIIFCVGKSQTAHEKISALSFGQHISISVIGFTNRVSDLLSIADLLITKSGSVSFYEGIFMNIPMILDSTTTILYWERLNHIMLENYKWGIKLNNVKNLNEIILQILTPTTHQAIAQRLKQYPKFRLDQEIVPIVKKLIN